MTFKLSIFILLLSCILLSQFAFDVLPSYAQQGEAEVLLAQATIAYEEEKYDEALRLLQQAQSLDPNNSRIFYYLGLTFLAKKQPATAITNLQTAFELRPSDLFNRYQLGVAYFALHNYEQASPLLFKVYEEQPQVEDLGFYVGFLRYRDKEYDKALEAFEVNRSQDPDIKQLALFYRGLVLGVLGIPEQAIVQLDEALLVEAVSPLTQSAIQLRNALAVGRGPNQEKKRLRIQVSVGGLYDDNAAINPNVSNDPVGQSLRSRKTTSPGFLASALFDYAWLRHGPFESTINYQFFQTLNFNDDLSRLNTQDHIVGTGAYYRGTVLENPYQVGLEYSFDYLLLDNVAFLSRHNPSLSFLLVEPSFKLPLLGSVGNLTSGIFRYQIKTFYNEPANNDPRFFGPEVRDGFNTMVGFSHVFRLFNDAHFVRFGYQYDNENTDGSNFTYRGNKFLTGGQISLPIPTFRLRYSLDIHWRDYNAAPNTFFPSYAPGTVKRKDIQYNHLVQLIDELPYNFSVIFQYQYLRNDSNLGVYDYTKNVFSLIINWTY
jgi:tetratricopeptide (TPR) repeat protein